MGSAASVPAALGAGDPVFTRLLERVEKRMGELAAGHGPVLARYAGETVAAGGKRLRPLLVLLAAGVPPPESERLIGAAVAVELVHAASLVHDDVLDGSELRRGKPTVVASGGRGPATATGDLLFSRAFAELVAGGGEGAVEAVRTGGAVEAVRTGGAVEAVRILSRASSELALGELMQRADAFDTEVSVERYLERSRLKTAVLFRAACELGALEGYGEPALLASFGERIGLAFQLLDDILDVTGPAERTGKPRGNDLLEGTVTLPLIAASAEDRELAALDLRQLRGVDDARRLCERIAATGALQTARTRALELVDGAKRALPALPERQRGALELVADGVVERFA